MPKSKEILLPLDVLGVDYSVAFVIYEFFDRNLKDRKDLIQEWVKKPQATIYTYAQEVIAYAEFAFPDALNEYVRKIIELLDLDAKEFKNVVELMSVVMAEHQLINWYKEI